MRTMEVIECLLQQLKLGYLVVPSGWLGSLMVNAFVIASNDWVLFSTRVQCFQQFVRAWDACDSDVIRCDRRERELYC